MFNDEIEARVTAIGEYVVTEKATVRSAAKRFGVSKSTVHKDLTQRLKDISPTLFCQAAEILALNRAERHIRGGNATRLKYKKDENYVNISSIDINRPKEYN